MKKTLLTLLILALAAGTGFAEKYEDDGNWKSGKSWNCDSGERHGGYDRDDDQDQAGDRYERKRSRKDKSDWKRDKRGGQDRRGGPDQETKELMKAYHTIIRDLGKQARAETDEARKAELVEQLRIKLNEAADLMERKQAQRLIKAEQMLDKLRARIEEARANRESHIEEQLDRILSGKPPRRPESLGGFRNDKRGRVGRGRPDADMPPPPMDGDWPGDDAPPPPPEDDMPGDDMPPAEE